jgi:hypothetical protein
MPSNREPVQRSLSGEDNAIGLKANTASLWELFIKPLCSLPRCGTEDKLKERIAWIEKFVELPGNIILPLAENARGELNGVLESANREIGVPGLRKFGQRF